MQSQFACYKTRWAFLFLLGLAGSSRADVVLDFQDIPIPGGTETTFFTYQSQGFTLTAIDPSTGFLSGFQAHGENSDFYAGEIGVAAFAPVAPPHNVIMLTQDSGESFSILSIDLARNFAFDPAPTVDFTGLRSDGTTVLASFAVTTPIGIASFQTFFFTGFNDLVSLSWGQPTFTEGIHQFANIHIAVAAIPEPSTLALSGLPALLGLFALRRRINAAA